MKRQFAGLFVAAAVLLVAVPHDAHSQNRELQRLLAAATRVNCSFSGMTTGTWNKDGTPSAEYKPTTLKLSFFDINIDEGTAEADSQFGASFIVVRYSNDYLHLIQMFGSGPLYVTTILAREASEGRLMAVHTRHEYTPTILAGFTSRPEMYLGDCSVEN